MYLLINELSFEAQARDLRDADKLMKDLILIIKSLRPIQGSDPIRTSKTLWEKELLKGYNVHQWLTETNKDQMRWFMAVVRKGPYIETLLDENLEYHECLFRVEDVSSTSLAGAVFYDGLLTSLRNSDRFGSERIPLRYREKNSFIEVEIINIYDPGNVTAVIEEIKKNIFHDILSWNNLWSQKDVLFAKLLFCACVKEQLSNLDFTPTNMKIVKEHLAKMNEYCKRIDDEKINPDYTQMGIRASRETDITLKRFGHQREFICPDGERRIFDWHSKQIGQNLRIHFYPPDDNNKHFLIGYIGRHLNTYEHH